MAAHVLTNEEFFTYDYTGFSKEELLDFANEHQIKTPNITSVKKLYQHIRQARLDQMTSTPPNEEYSYAELAAIYYELGGDINDLLELVRNQVTLVYDQVKNPGPKPKPKTAIVRKAKKLPVPLTSSKLIPKVTQPPNISTKSSKPSKPPVPSKSTKFNPPNQSKPLVDRLLELYNQRAVIGDDMRDQLESEIAATQANIDAITKDRIAKIANSPPIAKQTYGELNDIYNQLEEDGNPDSFNTLVDIYGTELIKMWLRWRQHEGYHHAVLDSHFKQLIAQADITSNDFQHIQRVLITIPLDVEWNFNDHFGGSHDLLERIVEDVLRETDIVYNIFYDQDEGLSIEFMSDEPFDVNVLYNDIIDRMEFTHTHRFVPKSSYSDKDINAIREVFRTKIISLIGDNLGDGIYSGVMYDGKNGYLILLTSANPIDQETIDQLVNLLSGKMVATLKK